MSGVRQSVKPCAPAQGLHSLEMLDKVALSASEAETFHDTPQFEAQDQDQRQFALLGALTHTLPFCLGMASGACIWDAASSCKQRVGPISLSSIDSLIVPPLCPSRPAAPPHTAPTRSGCLFACVGGGLRTVWVVPRRAGACFWTRSC